MKVITPVGERGFAYESKVFGSTFRSLPGRWSVLGPEFGDIAAEDIPNTNRPPTPFANGATSESEDRSNQCSPAPSMVRGAGNVLSSCSCMKPRADGLRKAERVARAAPSRGVLKPADGAESAKKIVRFSEQLEHMIPDWSPPIAEECADCSPLPAVASVEDGKRPLEEDFSWLAVFAAGGNWVAESTLKLASPIAQGAWDWLAPGGVTAVSGSPKRRKQVSWAVWTGGSL